jgi:ribonuclease BN (tRNA processing enzyme)
MHKKSAEIIFIGTSSGLTSLKRNHSSILIKVDGNNLLVDAGDGISKALLIQGIGFNDINSVVFTHYHADHFAGIASLITQMKLSRRKIPLTIFTHMNLTRQLESLLESVYMFKETLGFEIHITGFGFNGKVDATNGIIFTAKQNSHLRKKDILINYNEGIFVSSSLLFEIAGQNIFYTSDIGSGQDLFLFPNHKIDCLITEACHINTNDIYDFLTVQNPSRVFITHYDDIYEKDLLQWKKSLPDSQKQRIIICCDGLSFSI